ncbi:MAG: 3-deoxy-7-phosphoheptulonate synthase [Clostridiales bacterium]|nr:3-deoxy-7-phosphoheptulonate synthase [Clostridiales bacterium]
MNFIRKLPIPKEIKELFPVTLAQAAVKKERDAQIRDILTGKSDKFLLIIGPCSADRSDAILAYLEKLKGAAEQTGDKLVIVPRVFTNKPRSEGTGYMGMLHQPDPASSPDLLRGLIAIRTLHLNALKDYGFTCADELLYPDNFRYLSDLLSYTTVGARSVEDQYHRLTASGLDIPVGMKNPISGSIGVMLNSILAANSKHAFLYRGWEVMTSGNPLTHAVLRGYKKPGGQDASNCTYDELCRIRETIGESGIACRSVIVDVNHSNSGKDPFRQIDISLDVLKSRAKNPDLRGMVRGLMIESYLEDGCQEVGGDRFGCSITDPCLGWEKTEKLIMDIADRV